MKKVATFCLMVLLSCSLISTGNVTCVSMENNGGNDVTSTDDLHPSSACGTHLIIPYQDGKGSFLKNLADSYDSEVIRFICEQYLAAAEDPYHSTYSFYSSMGCVDVGCTNTEHIHWCPSNICNNKAHGHSEEEYRNASYGNLSCPCHG